MNFKGEYADNGKALRRATRETVGNRCIRCGHPFVSGQHGKGEWSPCDAQCTHGGPFAIFLPKCGDFLPINSPLTAGENKVYAQWRILTVHHFDGNKANDAWWNHLALCQRCHLSIQSKVDPNTPYFFEHSDWLKPYVAGFYAKKYEGLDLTRDEVMSRLEELLKHEHRA
jgi:hypothetical protein